MIHLRGGRVMTSDTVVCLTSLGSGWISSSAMDYLGHLFMRGCIAHSHVQQLQTLILPLCITHQLTHSSTANHGD